MRVKLEHDYVLMEREMRLLGLSPERTKPNSTAATPGSPRLVESAFGQHSESLISSNNGIMPKAATTITTTKDDNNKATRAKLLLSSCSFTRQTPSATPFRIFTATPSLTVATNTLDTSHSSSSMLFTKTRKYSLDSYMLPTSQSSMFSTPHQHHTASFIKSLRRANDLLVDSTTTSGIVRSNSILAHRVQSSSKFKTLDPSLPTLLQQQHKQKNHPQQNHHSPSPPQPRPRPIRSSSINSFLDPHRLAASSSTSPYLPRILVTKTRSFNTKSNNNNKRSASIMRDPLDIPVVYKYSNAGLERYKADPTFYLPNGEMRRKYSLPALTDSIEMVKNLFYLRHNANEDEKDNKVNNESGAAKDHSVAIIDDVRDKDI